MDVTALQDRILVKHINPETVSPLGIVISRGIDKSYEAVVLKVGPGRTTKTGVLIPLDIQVNDQILFDGAAGIKVKIEGEDLLILKEEEVLAILD